MPDVPVAKQCYPCLVYLFLVSTKRNAVHVFHCFPVVLSAQFIFFYLPCDPKPGNHCDICHPTLSIQFHNNCSITTHNLQAPVCQLHFLLSHLFIFPSTHSAYPQSEKMRVWYPLSVGESHFGGSRLADPCIWSVLAHWILLGFSLGHICKQGWHLSGSNYHAHPTVHLF